MFNRLPIGQSAPGGVLKQITLILGSALFGLTAFAADIERSDGTKVSGEITFVSANNLEIKTSGSVTQKIPFENIQRVVFGAVKAANVFPYHEILLSDGTKLRVKNLKFTENTLEFELLQKANAEAATAFDGKDLKKDGVVEIDHLAYVLKNAHEEANRTSFARILSFPTRFDRAVFKTGTGMDAIDGTFSKFDSTAPQFEFLRQTGEEKPLALRLGRLAALSFSRLPKPGSVAERKCKLVDVYGNEIELTNFKVKHASLELETVSGFKVPNVAFSEIRHLDFTDGLIVYLSDLKPKFALEGEKVAELEPRRKTGFALNQSLTGENMQLKIGKDETGDTRVFRKGVVLLSGVKLSFSLDGKYSALRTYVGVEERSQTDSAGKVYFIADGKRVADIPFAKDKMTTYFDSASEKVDLRGVKTLVIEAVSDGVDFGNQVTLGNPLLVLDKTK